jgi:uncharacterized protein (DUF58 family)
VDAASAVAAFPASSAAAHPWWALRSRAREWLESRLPRGDTWVLSQHNVYILPTRAGWAFAAMLVLMLLGSINYQLNLGHVLTFMLAACALVSMHLTHANLKGLTLRLRPPAAVFAGEAARIEIVVTNPGIVRHGIGLALRGQAGHADGRAWIEVPAHGQAGATLAEVPPRRGRHALPTLVAETRFPLGLFRAWTVWRPAAELLVWPRPEVPVPPLPTSLAIRGEAAQSRVAAGNEIEGVRAWRRGDTLRQVVWKKFARVGELVSRETRSSISSRLWLEWSAARTPAGDAEARIARLAAWIVAADRAGVVYGLRLPARDFAPAQGEAHRRTLLEALALLP